MNYHFAGLLFKFDSPSLIMETVTSSFRTVAGSSPLFRMNMDEFGVAENQINARAN